MCQHLLPSHKPFSLAWHNGLIARHGQTSPSFCSWAHIVLFPHMSRKYPSNNGWKQKRDTREIKVSLGCPRLQLEVSEKEVEEEHRGSEKACRRGNEAVGRRSSSLTAFAGVSAGLLFQELVKRWLLGCLINNNPHPWCKTEERCACCHYLTESRGLKLVGPLEISTFCFLAFT